MRVLGIDPGLNITGYGLLDETERQIKVVEIGVIRTDPKTDMASRLKTIGEDLQSVIEQFHPDIMAIEELYSHYNHPKTAIIMGHARGVAFLKAASAGMEVVSYAATRIKNSITGHGRASKEQIQLMIKSSLGLSQIPDPPDAADAVAVALCHLQAIEHATGVKS